MRKRYDLFLSPHPDDLLFSAYSALLDDDSFPKLAIEYFSLSKFTRWGVFPLLIVTPWRIMEEIAVMGAHKVKPRFLFLRDMTVGRPTRNEILKLPKLGSILHDVPKHIYSPLGIGGNPDHLAVRFSAVDFWRESCGSKPELFFYEDLPYAARDFTSGTLENCLKQVERIGNCTLRAKARPLSEEGIHRKASLCKIYLSQTNHGSLLVRYAKQLGKEYGYDFAERYFVAEPDKST